MAVSDLSDLFQILRARYQAQQNSFQKVVAEEHRLRAELKRIDTQAKAAEARPQLEMKAIGADVIWKSWVGRSKQSLNIKLAQVLAQKEHQARHVKRAYGKMLVTQQMMDDAIKQAASEKSRAQLLSAMEQAIFSKTPDQ
jgi:hypothetical protein